MLKSAENLIEYIEGLIEKANDENGLNSKYFEKRKGGIHFNPLNYHLNDYYLGTSPFLVMKYNKFNISLSQDTDHNSYDIEGDKIVRINITRDIIKKEDIDSKMLKRDFERITNLYYDVSTHSNVVLLVNIFLKSKFKFVEFDQIKDYDWLNNEYHAKYTENYNAKVIKGMMEYKINSSFEFIIDNKNKILEFIFALVGTDYDQIKKELWENKELTEQQRVEGYNSYFIKVKGNAKNTDEVLDKAKKQANGILIYLYDINNTDEIIPNISSYSIIFKSDLRKCLEHNQIYNPKTIEIIKKLNNTNEDIPIETIAKELAKVKNNSFFF